LVAGFLVVAFFLDAGLFLVAVFLVVVFVAAGFLVAAFFLGAGLFLVVVFLVVVFLVLRFDINFTSFQIRKWIFGPKIGEKISNKPFLINMVRRDKIKWNRQSSSI